MAASKEEITAALILLGVPFAEPMTLRRGESDWYVRRESPGRNSNCVVCDSKDRHALGFDGDCSLLGCSYAGRRPWSRVPDILIKLINDSD